jgi:phosphopantetheine binding protein
MPSPPPPRMRRAGQALALLARLQPLFGDAVTPELLLEAPTVAELAARLEAAISPRA